MAHSPRVTLFFEQYEQGWTESHLLAPPATLQQLQDRALVLARRRADLLALGPVLNWMRLSLDDSKTDAKIVGPLNYTTRQPRRTEADFAWTTVLLRLEGTPSGLYHKVLYLSGIEDAWTINNQVPTPPAEWVETYNDWTEELLSGRWGFKVLHRAGTFSGIRPIYGADLADRILTVYCPAHGFTLGEKVHLAYVRWDGDATPNGDRDIVGVADPDHFQVGYEGNAFLYKSSGWAKRAIYEFTAYSEVQINRLNPHVRGKRYRPVSWDLPTRPGFRLSPCGRIVDLLSSCYTAPVRFSEGSDQTIPRRWYFVPPTYKIGPYTLFGSSVWHDDRFDITGAAELREGHVWNKGVNLQSLKGICKVGTEEEFGIGLLPEQLDASVPYPDCCLPPPWEPKADAVSGSVAVVLDWSGPVGLGVASTGAVALVLGWSGIEGGGEFSTGSLGSLVGFAADLGAGAGSTGSLGSLVGFAADLGAGAGSTGSLGSLVGFPATVTTTFAGQGSLGMLVGFPATVTTTFAGQGSLGMLVGFPATVTTTFAGQGSLRVLVGFPATVTTTFPGQGSLRVLVGFPGKLGTGTGLTGSLKLLVGFPATVTTTFPGQGSLGMLVGFPATVTTTFPGQGSLGMLVGFPATVTTTFPGQGSLGMLVGFPATVTTGSPSQESMNVLVGFNAVVQDGSAPPDPGESSDEAMIHVTINP